MMPDAVSFLVDLIRCPSVTPQDAGTLDRITAWLQPMGFTCVRLPFGQGQDRVDNLFAHRGEGSPHLCFAGHVDVVPTGPLTDWIHPPFSGTQDQGKIWGRGAADMKGAIAAFLAALQDMPSDHSGKISLLLTADEEGPGIHGTKPVLSWLKDHHLLPDMCLVGEPTSGDTLADTVKIGRRGSLNAIITVHGTQGHVAYPHFAHNPLHDAAAILGILLEKPLDQGHPHFDASNLEITSVDTGNGTTNIIPPSCTVRLNIRFNAHHSAQSLSDRLHHACQRVLPQGPASGPHYTLTTDCSSEAFFTNADHPLVQTVTRVIQDITGTPPILSTSGGTSDARFIKDYCPVVELGLPNATIHKINEQCDVNDLMRLSQIYGDIVRVCLEKKVVF
jgi:succinyl-diaminopimelate desuccinylase